MEYDEIAKAVDTSPAVVRQIAHRVWGHVAARRPCNVVSAAETRHALEAFQWSIETGDLQRLVDILAPDVVFLRDGRRVAQTAPAPVVGADMVVHLLCRIESAASLQLAQVNGRTAPVIWLDGKTDTAIAPRVDDGLIPGFTRCAIREAIAYGSGD